MNSEYLETFARRHKGSKIAFRFNKDSTLDYVSLQTDTMSKVLQKFPEVLLMIRYQNSQKRSLYTFLADGPCLRTPTNVGKIVHVALPKNETNEGLEHMFQFLKDFNTCSSEIRIFLVHPHFRGADAILRVFPSAEIILSAYHVCRFFQQSIYQLSLPDQTEHLLIQALKNTMCSATKENLRNLHMFLKQFVKPDILRQLKPNWLLEDRIWALHCWRHSSDCFTYFQTVDTLSLDISELFRKSQSMGIVIKNLIEYIQTNTLDKEVLEKRYCTSYELDIIAGKECKAEASPPVPSNNDEAASLIRKSLEDICNPAAFDLCQKELEVAQKSVRLIGTDQEIVNVQLLEGPNEITYGTPYSCTCNFNQSFKLPCRHILAVVSSSKQVIQPDMLHKCWQKQTEGTESALPISHDTLEIIVGDQSGVPEKDLLVESLSTQLSQLMAECSDEVFQQRYNTLRELADAWIGPYEQVKL